MKKKKDDDAVFCDSCGKKLKKSEALSDVEPFAHEVWNKVHHLHCCDDEVCLRKFEKALRESAADI